MGFLDNIFNNEDGKKSGGGGSSNSNNNPLANIRKNMEQLGKPKAPRMRGPGQSLGGAKPGDVLEIVLPHPGPLGVRIEKRSNNSESAIVNMVVPGSQAEAAGLLRGDVLCFAGSGGQNDIPYNMFLDIAKSTDRPIHLDVRRLDQTKSVPTTSGGGSADAEARRRAMIAAAEAREKKHKSQTKSIKHVTKSTLLKQQQQQQQLQQELPQAPQTEASRRAAQAAKQGEAHLAAELGYNPYEAIKKTAGQARAATTTTQHGAITAPGSSGGGGSLPAIPAVAAPQAATTAAASNETTPIPDDPRFPYHEFEEALAIILSSDEPASAKSGLKISKKLVVNATTKGQQPGAAGEKFRRVRLANPKIKAAIVAVPGNLPLLLSVGFELHPDDANPDESLLVFPPGFGGPKWLSRALQVLERTEQQLA